MQKSLQNLYKMPNWNRAVIKIGSALVAPEGYRISNKYALDIASFITACRNQGKEIILVSSGAIAAGFSMSGKETFGQFSIQEKQAMAAIGQPLLMSFWSKFFDFPCAQLLLTYQGIYDRQRFVNAKNTLLELLSWKTLPIINENDTVVIDEIKVGDNDNLAAHVAVLAGADILFICTDINGLYDSNPKKEKKAEQIKVVQTINKSIYDLADGPGSKCATGGMVTKIQAAEKATSRGIDTIIFDGTRRKNFEKILNDELCGTIFIKCSSPLKAKKHWMVHTLKSKGSIFVDLGAKKAIMQKGASLLPSGIINVHGNFDIGDAVDIIYQKEFDDQKIAKGIVHYNSQDLKKIKGVKSSEIKSILGFIYTDEVIHRDDLVVL